MDGVTTAPPATGQDDPFRILQVHPRAPRDLIDEVYWHLVEQVRRVTDDATFPAAVARLNAAYEAIADNERRRALVDERYPRRDNAAAAQRPRAARRFGFGRPAEPAQPSGPTDYFALLQVDRAASDGIIELAAAYHRARASGLSLEHAERREAVREAEETLLDPERRAEHEAALRKHERRRRMSVLPGSTNGTKPKHAAAKNGATANGRSRDVAPGNGVSAEAEPVERVTPAAAAGGANEDDSASRRLPELAMADEAAPWAPTTAPAVALVVTPAPDAAGAGPVGIGETAAVVSEAEAAGAGEAAPRDVAVDAPGDTAAAEEREAAHDEAAGAVAQSRRADGPVEIDEIDEPAADDERADDEDAGDDAATTAGAGEPAIARVADVLRSGGAALLARARALRRQDEAISEEEFSAAYARLLALRSNGDAPYEAGERAAGAAPVPVEAAPAPARLTFTAGPRAGQVVDLGAGGVTLGSDPACDVVLTSDAHAGALVALEHAWLWRQAGHYMLRQIGGAETLIGGEPLALPIVVLEDGDELTIGPHVLRFTLAEAPAAPADAGLASTA
jgi:hypothetical protein